MIRNLTRAVIVVIVVLQGISAGRSMEAATTLQQDGRELFQQALLRERADGKLEEAIEIYRRVLDVAADRGLAAQALVRIGACYEKLGRPEASDTYEQLLRDYPDQAEPVATVRARLAALEVESTQPSGALHTELLWTTDRAVSPQGSVSQDGSLMTYVDWSDLGNLAIHDFATGESRRLTHTADNDSLFAHNSRISPDGEQVVYGWCCDSGGTELRLLSLQGAQQEPRTVWSPADGGNASVQDWFPSGDRVVAVVSGPYRTPGTQQIITVSTDDGQVQQIRSVEWERDLTVRVSPDGRYLAYSQAASRDDQAHDVFVVAVDGSSESVVVQHAANDRLVGWDPGGRHLLFSSDRIGVPGLWAQRVQDGTPAGEPQLLVSNFSGGPLDTREGSPLGVTRDGTLHYVVRVNQRRLKTAELDFTTGKFLRQPVEGVERFLGHNYWPTFSPDGETFAYVSTRPGGTTSIVFRLLKTGEERDLLPLGLQEVQRLRWSPGGHLTVGGRDDRGRIGIFVVDLATGQTRPLGGPEEPAGFMTPDGTEGILTPDGTQILHRDFSSGQQTDSLFSYRVADGSVHALSGDFQASSGGYVAGGSFFLSPDGQWIATIRGRTNEFVGVEIRLHGVAGGDGRVLTTTGDDERFGRWVTWTPDSSALVVLKQEPQAGEGMRLWVVPVDGSAPVATELVYQPRAGGRPGLIIHPDGTRIFYHEGNSSYQFFALHNLGLD